MPLALLSKILIRDLDKRARGTSARVPCYVGFSHSNLVHLNTHEAHEVAVLTSQGFEVHLNDFHEVGSPMSLLHEQPNSVWEGSSIVIVIKFRSKRLGFSTANSMCLMGVQMHQVRVAESNVARHTG